MRKALQEHVLNPAYLENLDLRTAVFGDEVGLIGALALAAIGFPHNSMAQHSQRWIVANRISPEIDLALCEYPPIFRQILANRGYTTPSSADQYLKAELPSGQRRPGDAWHARGG